MLKSFVRLQELQVHISTFKKQNKTKTSQCVYLNYMTEMKEELSGESDLTSSVLHSLEMCTMLIYTKSHKEYQT